MRNLNDAGRSPCGPTLAAAGALFDTKGFTGGDLRLLQEAHRSGVANRGWGRAQFATNEFSEYLAIWENGSDAHDLPSVVIARFLATGTYALLIRAKIVASGKSLQAIIPGLGAAQPATETS